MVNITGDLEELAPGKKGTLLARFRALYAQRAQRRRQRWVIFALLVSDVLLALLVWSVVSVLYDTPSSSAAVQRLHEVWDSGTLSQVAALSALPIVVVWISARTLVGLYPGYALTTAEEVRRQTYALAATVAIASIFALVFHVGILLPRLPVAIGFLSLLFLAPLLRVFVTGRLIKIGLWGKPVVILGSGEAAQRVMRSLRSSPEIGLIPIAAFDEGEAPEGGMLESVPYGGALEEAGDLAHEGVVDTAIIAMAGAGRSEFVTAFNWASTVFQNLILVPSRLDGTAIGNSSVRGRDLAGILGLEVKHNLLNPWAQRTKRTMDLVLVVTGGSLILLPLLALSLLVRLESRGAVFYRDHRMGKNDKPFYCLKFRTMVPDAEDLLRQLLAENAHLREEYSKYHKLRDDPRVTRVGRFLRKTSLDELPQLWNVFRGEMSLVGPRPYLLRESADIGRAQSEILRVRPGMTGPWQVAGRNNTSFAERTQIDVYYVRNWSVWLDLVLLARTVKIIALRVGAR